MNLFRIDRGLRFGVAFLAVLLGTSQAWAHFVWVLLPEPGSREFGVVLSEGVHPDDPQYLERMADATVTLHGVDGQRREVKLTLGDDRLVGTIPDDFAAVAIEVPVTWGVIERGGQAFLLKYRALSLLDLSLSERLKLESSSSSGPLLRLQPHVKGVQVRGAVGQAPLGETAIKVVGGQEPVELTTTSQGIALWTPTSSGEYGLYAKASAAVSGQWGDLKYEEVRTYVTVSVRVDQRDWATDAAGTGSSEVQVRSVAGKELGITIPELPFGITSFGAARVGESIYVYGGHTGSAHSYWNTSQSNQLLRWDTTAVEGLWEVVAEGQHRLQGLAMVSHGERLILVGGFFATNEEGEAHQLYSQSQVVAFDTNSRQWSPLPSLPQGRSSHDAIVLDDRLYVVGGWAMDGPDSTQWHDSAWVLNLQDAEAGWQELPAPGFQRRALALAAFDGKLFALGGMERQGGPTRRTSIFDPQSQSWTDGPELVGDQGMVGFGAAAWPLDGRLVVTAYDGSVQVLSVDQGAWEVVGQTEDARFFHRLLPYSSGHLVLVGGASMEVGKFQQPEILRIEFPAEIKTE